MKIIPIAIVTIMSAEIAIADDWGLPSEKDYFSQSRRFVAHVTPRKDVREAPPILEVFEIRDAERVARWWCTLGNEYAPMEVFVSDDGGHVVTVNEHGAVGYGDHVVAFYKESGIIEHYTLEEILHVPEEMSAPELGRLILQSVGSRWWDSNSIKFFDVPTGRLHFCIWIQVLDRWVAWDATTGQEATIDGAMMSRLNERARLRSLSHSGSVEGAIPQPRTSDPNGATLGYSFSDGELTFARGQWPLLVPVRLGLQSYDFVLDTGCTSTMFDLSLRAQLGEPKGKRKTSSAGGPMTVEVFAAPDASIGPFNLNECGEVTCADLKGLARIVWKDVRGILGMDFLGKHVLRIDFDEGRVVFLDERRETQPSWGEEFPITYNRMRMPQMRATVEQWEQDFVVDTGFDGTGAVAKKGFRLAAAKGRLKPVGTSMFGVTGDVESKLVRVDDVTVGAFEYHGVILAEAASNLLGLDFLSRHVVTFDFPNDRLYLRKGRDFDKRDEAGMCGVSLTRSEGRTVVSGVDRNRPAAKAGIHVGDVILTLAGRRADTFQMWEIGDLLRSGHGIEIAMTIQRGDEVKSVVVVLERQI